jgi:hypothetical protein
MVMTKLELLEKELSEFKDLSIFPILKKASKMFYNFLEEEGELEEMTDEDFLNHVIGNAIENINTELDEIPY